MVRSTRKRGESGFYHVVTKGDGGQILFEGDADRRQYLRYLEQAIDEHGVEIHAYCLMSNHVHLLIRDKENDLSAFMKRLNENYARYYSWRTGRVGHVFNGRFWSEPIESDEYYLSVMRYIHANPEPPGICRARDYAWSSYSAYLGNPSFTTTDFALRLLGSVEAFENLHLSGCKYAKPFRKSLLKGHLGPDELACIANNLLGRETLGSLRSMRPVARRPYLEALSNAGFSEREIARVTRIGQASIHRTLQ